MKKQIEVDNSGRILIPYNYRRKYNIQNNDILLLSVIDNGFKLIKEDNIKMCDPLINKLINIEINYSISFLLLKDNLVVYTSDDYKNLRNGLIDTTSIISKLNSNIYKTKMELVDKSNLKLFLIYKRTEQKLIDLISIALS